MKQDKTQYDPYEYNNNDGVKNDGVSACHAIGGNPIFVKSSFRVFIIHPPSRYRAPTSRSSQFGDFCGFSSAAGENATHGKRRTNADKRAAVLRWLEDDEGQQWSDEHISKQCCVSITAVRNAMESLLLNKGEDYQRPDRRRYIDKHGNVSWMETAKINISGNSVM